jgi:DNA-binding HxlR family transcriptional regulator
MAHKGLSARKDASCDEACPVARTARLIEGKWTTRIVRDLLAGKKRYSELQRSLTGISPKVLAERLRFLEDEGLIEKTIYPVVPPHTEYRLTDLGRKLRGVIAAMARFGEALSE